MHSSGIFVKNSAVVVWTCVWVIYSLHLVCVSLCQHQVISLLGMQCLDSVMMIPNTSCMVASAITGLLCHQLAFSSMTTSTRLIFAIYKPDIFSYFLVGFFSHFCLQSLKVCTIKVLFLFPQVYFQVLWSCFLSLYLCLLLSLCVYWNVIISMISFSVFVLAKQKDSQFLCAYHLMNVFMISMKFLVASLGFAMSNIVSPTVKDNFTSFPICVCVFFYYYSR